MTLGPDGNLYVSNFGFGFPAGMGSDCADHLTLVFQATAQLFSAVHCAVLKRFHEFCKNVNIAAR